MTRTVVDPAEHRAPIEALLANHQAFVRYEAFARELEMGNAVANTRCRRTVVQKDASPRCSPAHTKKRSNASSTACGASSVR